MLPIKDVQWKKIKVGEDELEIRAWKTKEEKNYLILREQGVLNDDTLFDALVSPCIKDVEKYNFTENQKQYIMVKIREISLGSDIDIGFTCEECKNFQEITIDLNDIVTYKPEKFYDVKIDDYTFVMKKNNSPKVKERLDSFETDVEKDFALLCLSIDKVLKGKEEYDTFSFDEIYSFVENLDSKVFNKLFDEFYNMIDHISFYYKVKCQICGHENEDDLETIPNFLWD